MPEISQGALLMKNLRSPYLPRSIAFQRRGVCAFEQKFCIWSKYESFYQLVDARSAKEATGMPSQGQSSFAPCARCKRACR